MPKLVKATIVKASFGKGHSLCQYDKDKGRLAATIVKESLEVFEVGSEVAIIPFAEYDRLIRNAKRSS